MRTLFNLALGDKKHRLLILCVIISMILLTVASQMEIFALGVVSRKGPDFFELFGPLTNGELHTAEGVTPEQVAQRWQMIDTTGSGTITHLDATAFVAKNSQTNLFDSAMTLLDSHFALTGNLANLAIFIVIISLFKALTTFSQRFSSKLVSIWISRDLREKYFTHFQAMPMSFYQEYNIGSLSSRITNDSYLIADGINACLMNYLQMPFTVVTTLALCFMTSWKLSLIMFFGLPMILFPIIFIARRIKRLSRQFLANQERFLSLLIDFIGGVMTVKVFVMESFALHKYVEQNNSLAHLEQRSARYDSAARPIIHFVGMFFLATALLYGLYVEQMSVAEILFFCGLLYIFYEPIKKFAEENSLIQWGVAAADRMSEVINMKSHIKDHEAAEELKGFKDSIEFDDVWFKYNENWVLKGLSFTAKKGQIVAIVGPTGAGKSTIVQLLPRLYDPQKGEIRIDGIPLTKYTQASVRENISYVPQKPFLFIDTVAVNIAFGRDFPRERIVAASVKAHADEFIRRLPNGYDTLLAEAGKDLSGGQQQRVAIARAIVKDAPILIMDEATSSLDMISENHIKEAMESLRGKVTQIVIAHRLSTIEDADKIIYLDDGQKVAEGTKDELLKSCPSFRLMWELMHSAHRLPEIVQ